ncbi:MAG: phosphoribosylglycinamide formyltransferase [Candidatus Omnitrophota bacterium]
MKRIAVLASGFGSNLAAIIQAVKRKKIKGAKVALVISDRQDAYVLKRAEKHNIPAVCIAASLDQSRTDYDKSVVKELKHHKIDMVVLAGFMRMISPYFVRAFRNKIINIHPALLPAFKGTDGIGAALCDGAKITGVTVHFVDEQMDHGPIILQSPVEVRDNDTRETLAKKIHVLEHQLLPQTIDLFVKGKLKISGRRVLIKN